MWTRVCLRTCMRMCFTSSSSSSSIVVAFVNSTSLFLRHAKWFICLRSYHYMDMCVCLCIYNINCVYLTRASNVRYLSIFLQHCEPLHCGAAQKKHYLVHSKWFLVAAKRQKRFTANSHTANNTDASTESTTSSAAHRGRKATFDLFAQCTMFFFVYFLFNCYCYKNTMMTAKLVCVHLVYTHIKCRIHSLKVLPISWSDSSAALARMYDAYCNSVNSRNGIAIGIT